MSGDGKATYVALSGGIGGAKLSLGLARLLGERLTVIVNTGDDFEHLGLAISPDVDTTLYTLAGVANPETGWGRRDETWSFMEAMAQLGGPTWFRLGDRDLATHVERTRRLKAGETLTAVTAHLAAAVGGDGARPAHDATIRCARWWRPMRGRSRSRTISCATSAGLWSVRCATRGRPRRACPPQVEAALSAPTLAGIIVCPSNPWLSVDPILAVPGMRACDPGAAARR